MSASQGILTPERVGSAVQKVICGDCGTPVAELRGDVLLIRTKHHGEPHVTVISVAMLDKLAKGVQEYTQ